MAFLDFISNRNAVSQQSVAEKSQEQKPENAKQMHARQDGQERANRTPLDRMPPEQLAKVDAIKAKLEKATQHIDANTQTPSAAANHNDGREAARQNMTGQETQAPALSPTSAQAGKTAQEKSPAASPEPAAKTADKSQAQTMPRPRPSWER